MGQAGRHGFNWKRTLRGLALLFILDGCAFGPQTIHRDRFDYGHALAQSQREEILMNIVRLRYMESPMFMSVTSVVNSYGVEGHFDGGSSWGWNRNRNYGRTDTAGTGTRVSTNGVNIGTGSSFSVRPTITYAPTVGKHFTESILTPIRPEALLAMIEAGWRVEVLFPMVVSSINGIRNRFYGGSQNQAIDNEFTRLVALLAKMQDDEVLSIRVHKSKDEDIPSFLMIISDARTEEQRGIIREMKDLLGIDPDVDSYKIVFGTLPQDKTEIAMVTRSILSVLVDMSSYVRVPDSDIEEGRAHAGAPLDDGMPFPMIVYCAESVGGDAYIKVRHRGLWYWIDDRDLKSKRTFTIIQLLAAMAEAPTAAQTPLVTIPAG